MTEKVAVSEVATFGVDDNTSHTWLVKHIILLVGSQLIHHIFSPLFHLPNGGKHSFVIDVIDHINVELYTPFLDKVDIIAGISLLVEQLVFTQTDGFEIINDSGLEVMMFIREELDSFEDITVGFSNNLLSQIFRKFRKKLLRFLIFLLESAILNVLLDSVV